MNILLFHLKNSLKKTLFEFDGSNVFQNNWDRATRCDIPSVLFILQYMVLTGSRGSKNGIWPDGAVVCVNEFRSQF